MKQSKSQYQTLRTRKFSFKAFDLSKYPIKNFQSTINVLSNKGDEKELDTDDPPEQITQNILSSSQLFLKTLNKRKGKDTGSGKRDR